jgi:hypothetical protein
MGMPAPGKLLDFVIRRTSAVSACIVAGVVALNGRHEIGRVIGDVAVDGNGYGPSVLTNPLRVHQASPALSAWRAATDTHVHSWLWWFLGVQLLLVVSVSALAWLADAAMQLNAGKWVRAAAIAWAAQWAAIAVAVQWRGGWWLLMGVTYLTWGVTILFVGRVAWTIRTLPSQRELLVRVGHAIGVQRFQLLIVALLAVLFVVPGPPILEQGVDVLRSWLLDAPNWSSLLWGLVAFALLAAVLRYLASVRAAPSFAHGEGAQQPVESPPLGELGREALVGSAVIASLVVVFLVIQDTSITHVNGRVALMTAVVIAAVPVIGVIVRSFQPKPWRVRQQATGAAVMRDRRMALVVGRHLAVAVPVILLVAMARSLFAPLLLSDASVLSIAVRLVGCAVLAALVLAWSAARAAPRPRMFPSDSWSAVVDPQMVGRGQPSQSERRRATDAEAKARLARVPGAVASVLPSALLTGVTAVPLLVAPLRTSRLLGLVGTVGLSLTMLTAFFMTMLILSQNLRAPYLFRVLGLRRTPAFELVLVIALLGVVFVKDADLHAARAPATASTVQRPFIGEAYSTWEASVNTHGTWPCALAVAEGGTLKKVQPLVMVAAEGGGVRAAWWTVDVMSKVASTQCGANSVLLASGVSGGAVGLGVMAATGDGSAQTAPLAAAGTMAAQDALAAGVSGLLVRDLIAGAFGLEIDPADTPDGLDRFPDRAGLMELAWERQVPALATTTFPDPTPNVPWHTVFNGTSVGYDCRVMISDVQIVSSASVNDCDTAGNEVPGAYDLFTKQPCYAGLPITTASLLAARFPYVTPSGVFLKDCTDGFADQSIDGGYAENTGIDTANAALAQVMPLVRRHNAEALAEGGDGVVIVPVVIYLHNTVAASQKSDPGEATAAAEATIPVLNRGAQEGGVKPEKLLAQSAVIAGQWVPDEYTGDLAALDAAVAGVLPSQVMTVAPQQKPQMALPLGWSMSIATQRTLDNAFDDYLHCVASAGDEAAAKCSAQYAFDTLLAGWGTVMRFSR